jgi:hypothetical protein
VAIYTCENEVEILCKGLKGNKAPGRDGITYEHLKYGGCYLYRCLARLFNSIRTYGDIPEEWKHGVIVPIYKGGEKSRCSPDSYRGVALLPVLFKVFETLINKRIDVFQNNKYFTNENQCEFQNGVVFPCSFFYSRICKTLHGKRGLFKSCYAR